MALTPAQREKARRKLAQSRGLSPAQISDSSIDLAIAAGNVLLSDLGSPSPSDSSAGWASGSCSSGSSSSDSGSSGGGSD